MKYKVGDKVRIITDLKEGQGKYGVATVICDMLKYAGIETQITAADNDETYRLQCDDSDWWWPETVLIPMKQTNADKIRQMTDEELARFLFDYMCSLTRPENIKTVSELLEWLQKPAELERKE